MGPSGAQLALNLRSNYVPFTFYVNVTRMIFQMRRLCPRALVGNESVYSQHSFACVIDGLLGS